MNHLLPLCPVCRTGHLHPATRVRTFRPRGDAVDVELLTSRCDHCGEETTRASQQKENLDRLAARKAHYGPLLLGEEVLALRKRYGLTQQDASKVFGKGKIAFSRYENEATYPDESTTLLLRLAIESPSVVKSLADKAQVELPLWSERCEDEQRVKLRLFAAPATQKRLEFRTPGKPHRAQDVWRRVLSTKVTVVNETTQVSETAQEFWAATEDAA